MGRSVHKIARWLAGKNYTLQPGIRYCCFWTERTITYRPQDPIQTQVAGLLHECGHVLIGRSVRRASGSARYRRGYPDGREGARRPAVSAADLVHEELEAWHRGHALAKTLRIRLDSSRYWQEYGRCALHYFRLAAKKDL